MRTYTLAISYSSFLELVTARITTSKFTSYRGGRKGPLSPALGLSEDEDGLEEGHVLSAFSEREGH